MANPSETSVIKRNYWLEQLAKDPPPVYDQGQFGSSVGFGVPGHVAALSILPKEEGLVDHLSLLPVRKNRKQRRRDSKRRK